MIPKHFVTQSLRIRFLMHCFVRCVLSNPRPLGDVDRSASTAVVGACADSQELKI